MRWDTDILWQYYGNQYASFLPSSPISTYTHNAFSHPSSMSDFCTIDNNPNTEVETEVSEADTLNKGVMGDLAHNRDITRLLHR